MTLAYLEFLPCSHRSPFVSSASEVLASWSFPSFYFNYAHFLTIQRVHLRASVISCEVYTTCFAGLSHRLLASLVSGYGENHQFCVFNNAYHPEKSIICTVTLLWSRWFKPNNMLTVIALRLDSIRSRRPSHFCPERCQTYLWHVPV